MGSDKPDHTIGISILEQALANLTAVVSATSLDIRALDNADIPHDSLPYDTKEFYKDDWVIDNGDFLAKVYRDTDWGEGLNIYLKSLTIYIVVGGVIMEQMQQGFMVAIVVLMGANRWRQTFNINNVAIVRVNGARYLAVTVPLNGIIFTPDEALQLYFFNYSGINWAAQDLWTWLKYHAK